MSDVTSQDERRSRLSSTRRELLERWRRGRAAHAPQTGLPEPETSPWRVVFDDLYRTPPAGEGEDDPTFNTNGWTSSFTGGRIPDPEMREWLEHTVERLLDLRPSRVLEVGCGTGLVLFRVAPHCRRYLGTDFSPEAIAYVDRNRTAATEHAELSERQANDFDGIETDAFDLAVLNSVAQYLPGVDYLLEVLEGLVRSVKSGGHVFVGDVRDLTLQPAFAAAVELERNDPSLAVEDLEERIQRRIAREGELLVDPALFAALAERLPDVRRVLVLVKGGRRGSEMTRFRYDAVLEVGADAPPDGATVWLDWDREELRPESLPSLLKERADEAVGLTGVPNAHVATELRLLELLRSGSRPRTVGDLRRSAQESTDAAVDPEALWSLGEELGCRVDLLRSAGGPAGCFDAVFRRSRPTTSESPALLPPVPPREPAFRRAAWADYVNSPRARRSEASRSASDG